MHAQDFYCDRFNVEAHSKNTLPGNSLRVTRGKQITWHASLHVHCILARILLKVTIYGRLWIGLDGHLDQSEAYHVSYWYENTYHPHTDSELQRASKNDCQIYSSASLLYLSRRTNTPFIFESTNLVLTFTCNFLFALRTRVMSARWIGEGDTSPPKGS